MIRLLEHGIHILGAFRSEALFLKVDFAQAIRSVCPLCPQAPMLSRRPELCIIEYGNEIVLCGWKVPQREFIGRLPGFGV